MTTRGPTTQQAAAPLCDYCNQKPKFSNHQYCSKTCASQAAALCNQCHKKPKFQNFEYCGKACAAVAKPQTRKLPAAATAQVQPQVAAAAAKVPKAKSAHPQKPAAAAPAFDPIQLAKLVAQQIPQVQALIASANSAQAGPTGPVAQPAPLAPAQAAPVVAKSKNPFLNLINSVQQSASANGTSAALSNTVPAQPLHISTQPTTDPAECLIPDCDQPVHVDAKGLKTSDYCSMRHREEAVATGLASPCIMCLTLPQSELDYFCGRACREESLNKFE